MQGILGYQKKQPIVVPANRQQNPWEILVPSLLQTVIGNWITGKLEAGRKKELYDQQFAQNKTLEEMRENAAMARTKESNAAQLKASGWRENPETGELMPPQIGTVELPTGERLITSGGRPWMEAPSASRQHELNKMDRSHIQYLDLIKERANYDRELELLRQGYTKDKFGNLVEPKITVDSKMVPGHHILLRGGKIVGAPITEDKMYEVDVDGKKIQLSGRDYVQYLGDKFNRGNITDKDAITILTHAASSSLDPGIGSAWIGNYWKAKDIYNDPGKALSRAMDPNFDFDIERNAMQEGVTPPNYPSQKRPQSRLGKKAIFKRWDEMNGAWEYKYDDGSTGYEP